MSSLIIDIPQLYRQTFRGKPYRLGDRQDTPAEDPGTINGSNDAGSLQGRWGSIPDRLTTDQGNNLIEHYLGLEVWLPIKFIQLPESLGMSELLLPFTTVKISGKKTIVKTALAERGGTVKELYSIDDYSISIKGFVVDENRVWPERDLLVLKELFELKEAVRMDNALTNIFLNREEMQRVVIQSIDFPEVSGGRKHVRPFSMQLESDMIFNLEVN